MDSLFNSLDAIYLLLFTAAGVMVAFAHREHKAARTMMLIAAALVIVRWSMWSLQGGTSLWVRSVVGALWGALLLGGVPEAWKWSKAKFSLVEGDTAQVQAPPQSETYGAEDLRKLTNRELREKAIEQANSMRIFEAEYKSKNSVRQLNNWSRMKGLPKDKRQAQWDADNLEDFQIQAAFSREFTAAYRPRGLAFLNEVSNRLGIERTALDRQALALTNGMLAGVSPVTQSADYLENLARKLP